MICYIYIYIIVIIEIVIVNPNEEVPGLVNNILIHVNMYCVCVFCNKIGIDVYCINILIHDNNELYSPNEEVAGLAMCETSLSLSLYIYIYMYIYYSNIYIYICIYIYRERELYG